MKKRIIIFISTILIIIASSVSVFALFSGVFRKYPTEITISNVSFLYNNTSYLNEIKTEDLNITKGEPTDVTLELKTKGNENIIADYTVSLYAEEESNNNTSLASAIDLYIYNGYRYEYVSALSELTSENKYQITGTCLSKTPSTISLQLVYNENINDAYFEEALKNIVTIKTDANAEITLNSEFYTFVSTKEEFKKALEETTNKEIVLTNDITIDEPLSGDNNGIDLNGHTLTLNKNVSITCTSDSSRNLYIGDLSNNGNIVVNDRASIYLSGKVVNVYNKFVEYVKLSNIGAQESLIKSSLYKVFESRIDSIPTKKEYSINDSFPLFDGYYPYISYITVNSDVLELKNSLYVIKDYSSLTDYSPVLYLTINDKKLSNQILLSDIGVNACIDELKNRFASKNVNYSLPLLSYDNKTRCHIEYIIDDNNNGNILNSDGIYQVNGIDYIKSLAKISIIKPSITVKVSYEHSYITYTLTENETINLIPLTEKQIESLILSNEAKILVCNSDTESSDTTISYSDNSSFVTSYLSKFNNTTSVELSKFEAGEAASKKYISINYTSKTIKAENIDVNKVIKTYINYTATFNFDDVVTYTFNTKFNVTLLGKEEYKTRYDISNRLSSKFRENDYISGNGYSFTGYGSLSPTVNKEKKAIYIKYEILTEEAKNYVAIIYQYNQVTKPESQVSYFAKNNDGTYIFSTSELTSATLDSNDTYFIDVTSLTNYDGVKYSISNGVAIESTSGTYGIAYTYEAFIQIKANLVPQVESTIVSIKATLYNDQAYTDPYLENNQEVSYTFTLTVEGIIHYGSEIGNVEDYTLYSKLLLMFDKNNDGLITYSESKQSMSEVETILTSKGIKDTYYKTNTTYNLSYLYFDSLGISSLAGLENFTNITGVSFNSNSIKSIESLRSLHSLKYASFNNDFVTDIEPLNLLDDLVYVSFDSNLITDIAALKYLSNLQYINLNKNKIVDLDGLTLLTNLKYLNLCNMTKNSIEFTNSTTISYELALIQINSSSAKIYTGSNSLYGLSDEDKIAVTILKELERINRVNQKLYLPSRFYTSETEYYNINWNCNNKNLIFTEVENSSYYSFSCKNDVINENVEFYISINDKIFQRVMNVNVYKTGSDTVYDRYIYNGIGYTNLTTLTDVDKTLIDALFNVYNIDDSSSTKVEVESDTSVPEQFVISESDFNNASSITSIDLSNKGITSLNGLDYFKSYIGSNTNISINLLGNSLASLEPLKSLSAIGTLKIGSAKYDFNELVSGSKEDNNEATLITISELYVNQCYNLSDYDVLKALFRYYFVSSNDIKIYLKDDSTVWDPYTELLPYKMTLLEDNITLYNTGEYDLANIFYTDTNGIAIDFYGYTHYFKFYSDYANTIYTRLLETKRTQWLSEISGFYCYNDYFKFGGGVLSYLKYMSGDETSYLVATLKSTTNSKKTISTTHTIQINAFDIAKNLIVTGLDNNTSSTLADMFNSKELKEEIINNYLAKNIDFTKTYTITLSDLQSKTSGLTSFRFTQMASNYSSNLFKGLHYLTKLTSITVNCDFYIGSGEELVNLTSITVKKSYVDFSTLNTKLENLTSLTLKENYGIIMPSDLGDKLVNLTSLTIDTFKGDNNNYNYMDLHQLTNLITSDGKSSIYTLKLDLVKSDKAAFTIGDVTNVIIPLRNAYYKANNSEPNYYIGTTTSGEVKDSTSALSFVLDSSNNVSYVYVGTNTQENRWNTEVSSSDTTIQTNAEVANNKIYDFGLMIGGTTPSSGSTWLSKGETDALKQIKGTTLWLPTNTKYFLYALYNDDTLLTNNLSYANLDMKWYYFKHDTNESQYKAEISGDTTDGYIKFSLDSDAYYIIIGTIPNKSAMFTYQFISGSGDGVYSSFTNNNLRFITYYYAELSNRITAWPGVSLENGKINHTDFAQYSGVDGLSSCTTWISNGYYYNNNVSGNMLYISSLADYEKEVINNYLFGDNGKFQQMTTINLPNAYYTINFTNTFGKLKNVTSLTATNTPIIFDENSFTNYTKLTSLNLESAFNFSPNSLRTLTKINSCLTFLNIKDTRCEHNLQALTMLGDWTSNTNSITIKLNYSKELTTTTANIKTNLTKIANDLSNKTYDISKTDNYLGYIYSNRKSSKSSTSYSPSGTTYTMNWTYADQFITNIGNVNLTSSTPVEVSVILSDSSFVIFDKIRYPFLAYNSQVSSNGKFKCDANQDGLGIEDLNYELLAYAIKQGAVSYENEFFVLTKDVTIDSNTSDGAIKNTNLNNFIVSSDGNYLIIKLTSTGKAIKVSKDQIWGLYNEYDTYKLYKNYGSYSDNKYNSVDPRALNKNYEYDFECDALPTKTNPYVYFDTNTGDKNIKLTINLPANKIVVYGKTYDLKLTLKDAAYLNYGIKINGNQVVIDSAKLLAATKQFKLNTVTEVIFKYYIEDNGTTYTSGDCFKIYINHLNSEDTYIDENYLYVLAQKDDAGYYLETNTNKVYFDSSKYVLANVSNGTYTLSDSGEYALINASYVFESGVFIKMMIAGEVTKQEYEKVNILDLKNNSRRVGKVLTNISSVGELYTNPSSYDTITSIKGIEYFKSLKILQLAGMIYGSLEGLENIQLERFFYNTNNSNPYVTVEDFSPLIKGSKDSLITFQYGAKGNTIMNDLSFVLEFTNLKNCYIENMNYKYNNKYVFSKEFAYLVYQLRKKNINVYMISNFLNDNNYLTKGNHAWDDVWIGEINPEYKLGFELLSLYNSNSSKFSKTPTFENDYSIKMDKSESDTYIYLPATVESDGKLYLLNYTTDTYNKAGFISNLGYYNVSTSGGETLVTDPDNLIESNDYYLTYLARTSMLYVKFKICSDASKNAYDLTSYNTIDVSLTCGMNEKKYSLSRRLTINYN